MFRAARTPFVAFLITLLLAGPIGVWSHIAEHAVGLEVTAASSANPATKSTCCHGHCDLETEEGRSVENLPGEEPVEHESDSCAICHHMLIPSGFGDAVVMLESSATSVLVRAPLDPFVFYLQLPRFFENRGPPV